MSDGFRPPASADAAPNEAALLVLAGPAGSGKTTLCERMVQEVAGFSRVITTTTRPPRPGEVNGIHYHFFDAETFDRKVAAGEFLEWAWVHQKHRYGTLASSVLEPLTHGRSLIINVDVQGVRNFREAAKKHPVLERHMAAVFIFVSLDELQRRMITRAQDHASEIAQRLETAERELMEATKFDFVIQSRAKDQDFRQLVEIYQGLRAKLRTSQRGSN